MIGPISPGGTERTRRQFRIRVRTLVVLVACCAPAFWVVREAWDRRWENRPARALRLLQSEDPGEQEEGFNQIYFLLMVDALKPPQVDAAVPPLLVRLRDKDPRVRERAMMSLFFIVSHAGYSLKAQPQAEAKVLPQAEAIVPGLMEAMRDPRHAVRRNAALAMTGIYFTYWNNWTVKPPLPKDLDGFVDVLCQVIEDPDPETPQWAFLILRETAPRLDRPPPAPIVAALGSTNPMIRASAATTIVKFPKGIDQVLPA
jgi:hypothetical protein